MKPEKYLEYLGRSSFAGKMASLPGLRKATGKVTKEIIKTLYSESGKNLDISQLSDIWNPSYGPDARFMAIRDELIPFFEHADRNKLKSVPIGYVYDNTPNGYAKPVPGGKGCVVCISVCLETLLQLINQTIFSVPISFIQEDEQAGMKRVYAYAASKGIHAIDAYTNLGDFFLLPPYPPKTTLEVLSKSKRASELQSYFIVAHELSHVARNHVSNDSSRSFEGIYMQELEADESAARVVYQIIKKGGMTDNQRTVELGLGAISQIFYAGQAIFDFSTIDKMSQNPYPSPEKRFAIVVDYFRSKLNFSNIMGGELFMRPYALISHVAHFMKKDPLESVGWLSEMANECRLMNDIYEEIYVLSLARDMASKARNNKVADQIQQYIDRAKQENNITTPIRESIHWVSETPDNIV